MSTVEARAVQAVDIGDAVCENRERSAGREMRVGDRLIAEERMAVVGLRGADENADFGIRDRRWTDAGVFQRFPGQLQQNALLRIDLLGFARRNAKDSRVETPDVVENAGGPGIALAALLPPRMTETSERKSVLGHSAHRATPLEQQGPELIDRIGTGQPARPPHNGNIVAELMDKRLHMD